MRRTLASALCEKSITDLRLAPAVSSRFGAIGNCDLVGRRLLRLERHGKVLLLHLSERMSVYIRLGMSGRLVLRPFGRRHDHFSIHFGADTCLTYNDFRRFGEVMVSRGDSNDKLRQLGPDALSSDFRSATLAIQTKRPIKAVLMDQKIVAGLGNIYSSESLFRAHINPCRPTKTLTTDERSAIILAIKATLAAAIARGGSTLDDYRGTEGEAGDFERRFAVYGRVGDSCHRCGTHSRIATTEIEQRTTYFCSTCQH